jgi:hypothetical protein
VKLFLTLFVTFLSFYTQATQYNYAGSLKANGQVIQFELHYDMNHKNILDGYSITGKNTNDETKSRIKGRYNSKTNAIFFYETVVLSSKAKYENLNFCLLTGTLYKKKKGNEITLSGNFLGFIRGTKKKCASGKITLTGKENITPITNIEKKIITKTMDTLYSNISAKKIIDYNWAAKSIQLQVWDDYNADGDVLSIYFNGKNILNNYTLLKTPKSLTINLDPNRKNILKIVANQEGKAPPNTARLTLSDGKTQRDLITHIKKNETVYIRLQ